VAINGAANAGLLAVRILALANATLGDELESYRQGLAAEARAQDKDLPGN
jgi:5-(carboxyamino)imidazole ribonucleotide mutase